MNLSYLIELWIRQSILSDLKIQNIFSANSVDIQKNILIGFSDILEAERNKFDIRYLLDFYDYEKRACDNCPYNITVRFSIYITTEEEACYHIISNLADKIRMRFLSCELENFTKNEFMDCFTLDENDVNKIYVTQQELSQICTFNLRKISGKFTPILSNNYNDKTRHEKMIELKLKATFTTRYFNL